MVVRGAPLIGDTGAYGLMLALQGDSLRCLPGCRVLAGLNAPAPTAINPAWDVGSVCPRLGGTAPPRAG